MIELGAPDRYARGDAAIARFVRVRNYMSEKPNVWTDDRFEGLKKLWSEGLSISQIGEALGVSRNSIAGKASNGLVETSITNQSFKG